MSILEICTYPDPVLAKEARKIENVNDDIITLIEDMKETMREAPGLGLAAPQVGRDLSLVICEVAKDQEGDGRLHVLLNPEIIESSGKVLSENEGCLSVPGYRADVRRALNIRVKAMDENEKPVDLEAGGFLATVLQHEIDHINGILFIDRISRIKRDSYKRKVKKMMKKQEKE